MKRHRLFTDWYWLGISRPAVLLAGWMIAGSWAWGQEELPPLPPVESASESASADIHAEEAITADDAALDDAALDESSDREPEVLLSGPLHEAFAEPIEMNAAAGIVISKDPPQPIEELVPEVRPDDEGAVWLPGYWAWDVEREDFIWVSGVWRVPPPNRRWVPGYWGEVEGGYQWVSGFWAEIETAQVEYLPPPPESLEQGPSSPQPGDEYVWVPGCWVYRDTNYAWRPGYWAPYLANWVWIPAHYVWTPRGVVFVDGYWDYSLADRGYLFSPVYVPSSYYASRPYYYRPRVLLNVARLVRHLFVAPRYYHYYYGDYYAPFYRQRGFYSWTDYYSRGYDPLLSYYQWFYAGRGIDYVGRLDRWNSYYLRNEAFRPPRRYDDFVSLARDANDRRSELYRDFAHDIREDRGDSDWMGDFRRVSREQQERYQRTVRSERELIRTRERTELEGRAEVGDRAQARAEARTRISPTGRLELPQSDQFRSAMRNRRREVPREFENRTGDLDRRAADLISRDQRGEGDNRRRSGERTSDVGGRGDRDIGAGDNIERGARNVDRAARDSVDRAARDLQRSTRDLDRDLRDGERGAGNSRPNIDIDNPSETLDRALDRSNRAERNIEERGESSRARTRGAERSEGRELDSRDLQRRLTPRNEIPAVREGSELRGAERARRESDAVNRGAANRDNLPNVRREIPREFQRDFERPRIEQPRMNEQPRIERPRIEQPPRETRQRPNVEITRDRGNSNRGNEFRSEVPRNIERSRPEMNLPDRGSSFRAEQPRVERERVEIRGGGDRGGGNRGGGDRGGGNDRGRGRGGRGRD